MFTFVTGGLRSGKSEYAIRRASEAGPPPWLYVAAHLEGDEELRTRLVGHRKDQDASWKLIGAPPAALSTALEPEALHGFGAVVIDRLTVWLSNRLAVTDRGADKALLGEIEVLADRLYRSTTLAALVTTEIGLGFLPANVPDRRLIDVAGIANQILSERADSVVLMVSGVALRLR
jgi:adenosylcobinamide kinase / adenosylcobinamide-phosphate guanylyltransferase